MKKKLKVVTIDVPRNKGGGIVFPGGCKKIYLVSDDLIKEGDWYIDDVDTVRESITSDKDYWAVRLDYVNIIATTDKSLIECEGCKRSKNIDTVYTCNCGCSSIKIIPQSFIQEYVKANGSIKEVEVEYIEYIGGCDPVDMEGPITVTKIDMIKTTANNEVIWSLPEIKEYDEKWLSELHSQKMYSRDEVVNLFDKYWIESHSPGSTILSEWINENLKETT